MFIIQFLTGLFRLWFADSRTMQYSMYWRCLHCGYDQS